MLTNLSVPDSIAPRISSLQVFPLSISSLVEGSKTSQVYYPIDGKFGPIKASGPIGLAISVSDGADEVTNRYAVYELSMKNQAGDTLFHQEIDHFKFEESETMFLDRIPGPNQHQRSFQKLFKTDGPEIPFYEVVEQNSTIIPTDSLSRYFIAANDIYGNYAQVQIEIQKSDLPEQNDIKEQPLYNWFWTADWASGNNLPFGFTAIRFRR